MSKSAQEVYISMKHLHEQAEAQLKHAEEVLLSIWRDTKDSRVAEYFKQHGGVYFDGVYMFHEKTEEAASAE